MPIDNKILTFRLFSGAYVDLVFPTETNPLNQVKLTTDDGAVAFEGDLTSKEWGTFFGNLCELDAPVTHSWTEAWVDSRVV